MASSLARCGVIALLFLVAWTGPAGTALAAPDRPAAPAARCEGPARSCPAEQHCPPACGPEPKSCPPYCPPKTPPCPPYCPPVTPQWKCPPYCPLSLDWLRDLLFRHDQGRPAPDHP